MVGKKVPKGENKKKKAGGLDKKGSVRDWDFFSEAKGRGAAKSQKCGL